MNLRHSLLRLTLAFLICLGMLAAPAYGQEPVTALVVPSGYMALLPSFLFDNGAWYAWFADEGCPFPSPDPLYSAFWMATSADGLSWGDVTLVKDRNWNPSYACGYNNFYGRHAALKIGSTYHLWVTYYQTDIWGQHIYHMQTTDLLAFAAAPMTDVTGPVLWEENRDSLSVLHDGTKFIMWYAKRQVYPYPWYFVRRTSTDGVSWTPEEQLFYLGQQPGGGLPLGGFQVIATDTAAKYLLFYGDYNAGRIFYRKSLNSEGTVWSEPVPFFGLYRFSIAQAGGSTYLYYRDYEEWGRVELFISPSGDVLVAPPAGLGTAYGASVRAGRFLQPATILACRQRGLVCLVSQWGPSHRGA